MNSIKIIHGTLFLIRFCLALPLLAAWFVLLGLAIAAAVASVYNVTALSPVISWLPGRWNEAPPFLYVIIYAFTASTVAWLISVLGDSSPPIASN